MYMKDVAYPSLPDSITWEDNTFDNVQMGMLFEYRGLVHDDGTAHEFNLKLVKNTVKNSVTPFEIHGGKNIKLISNTSIDCQQGAKLGYLSNFRLLDVVMFDNKFIRCGSVGGNGLYIYQVWRGQFLRNLFEDCGTGIAGSSNGIDFGTSGVSNSIDMLYNQFRSPTGKQLVAIQVEVSHTLSATTNRYIGNSIQGAQGNAFKSENSDSLEQLWTPTIGGATLDGVVTYTSQWGKYTKIGRRVDFFLVVSCTANASTGQIKISIPTKAQPQSTFQFQCGTATITSGAYTGVAVPIMDTTLDVGGLPAVTAGAILLQNSSLAAITSQAAMTINITGSYLAYPTQ
jgi:hypothetical protein